MSAKNLDTHNRWRNKTVAFRVSPEENKQIDAAVRLSGLTKQDYITRRLLDRAVVVQGNPRVYKALRDQLAAVLGELRRISRSLSSKLFSWGLFSVAASDILVAVACEMGCSPSAPTDGTGTVLFVSLESINLSILLHAAQRH